ncbi:MAG: MBL fold metallo-hydrolase [Myxococcota bacterium]
MSNSPLPQTIDCHYLQPRFAAAYLLTEGDEAAFVETNTTHAVPRLLDALQARGMKPEQVRYVVITHVHLDHAGGASALMRACPNATLLAHPRAAPHVIDPSRLVASARKVYGDEPFRQLYGEILPVDAARVRIMQDEEKLSWGSRTLHFFHTRGHANHHFCIHDSASNGVFTGDAFGLAYPVMQDRGLFIFPSTSPTDFDPDEARKAVRRIAGSGAARAYLTHYGEVTALREAEAQLLDHLDFADALLQRAIQSDLPDDKLASFCEAELRARFQRILEQRGLSLDAATAELIKLDLDLNGQGIAYVAVKRRAKPA